MTPSPPSPDLFTENGILPQRAGSKAAGIVMSLTLASRMLGYVRDMLIAWSFGAGIYADAFVVAFRLPNMFRRLVGEGALGMAFIPVFHDQALRQGPRAALALAIAAFRRLAVLLALVVLLGVVAAPLIVRALAPGFAVSGASFQLAVLLTRIMLPYLLLTGLVAMAMGILNALGHFTAPALAPLALNGAMITAVLLGVWWAPSLAMRAAVLAAGVVVGGGLQVVLQLPVLTARGIDFRKKVPLETGILARFGRATIPVLLGGAAYQVNVLLGTLLASYLAAGSVSYLFYADRLVQFPLGIFAVSAVTVVMPDLARQATQGHLEAVKATLLQSLQLVWFVILPSMVGLMVLREPIVAVLFGHGAFGSDSARLTANALLWYSIGLWAYAALRILLAVFYALQDAYRPLQAAAAGVLVNIGAGLALMPAMGSGGIALAASLAAVLNVVLLIVMLRSRIGPLGGPRLAAATGRIACCAFLMGAAVYGLDHWMAEHLGRTTGWQALRLGAGVAAGVGVYIAAAFFGKIPELQICRRLVFKGNKRS
jgi:putative peptidoglycan lipid II flippase